MTVGEVCIWQGWLPSKLPLAQATAITTMGAFVLFFVIRMAGATMEQKEEADGGGAAERGPLPLADPELVGRHHHHRRRGHLQLPVTRRRGAPRVPARRSWSATGPPTSSIRTTRTTCASAWGPSSRRLPTTAMLEFRMLRRDGASRDVEAVVSNQLDRPSVGGYVTNVRDITERKKFEELLSHRALHDPLTGLANRQLILDRADQMLVRARRNGDPVAAFFVDLDNFKDANDSLGHEAGDRLLQAVASRLVGLLRTSDTVGRLGGDEFVILAEGVSLSAGPGAIAERIRQVLKPAFYVEGFETIPITVSASVGIAVGDRPTAQDLLRDADIALYRAKGDGRDQSIVFEEAMQLAANDRLALRTELDAALVGRRVHPALPAHLRPDRPPHRGGRGPDPVEPPDQGDDPARPVHPRARGQRPDRRRRSLGARRGVRPGGPLAGRRAPTCRCRSTSRCASWSSTGFVDDVRAGARPPTAWPRTSSSSRSPSRC